MYMFLWYRLPDADRLDGVCKLRRSNASLLQARLAVQTLVQEESLVSGLHFSQHAD